MTDELTERQEPSPAAIRRVQELLADRRFLDALPQLVAALAAPEGASAEAWRDLACFLAAAGQQRLARRAAMAPGSSREERPLLSQAWFTLGSEIEEKGDFPTAAAAFLVALLLAEQADDRVAYAGRAADAFAKAGDPQGGYRLLLLLEREVREATDPDSLALWAMSFQGLHHNLGGKEEPSILREIRHKLPPELEDLPAPGRLPDNEGVERALGFFEREAAELEPDEVVLRHRSLLSTAMLKAGEGAWSEAADRLAEAEALEAAMDSPDPGLDRGILQARLLAYFGKPAEASALFAAIWPRVQQRAAPEGQLAVAGHYLEALGRWAAVESIPQVCELADAVAGLYEGALVGQPGSAARRQIRRTYQRVFEAALLALLTFAEVAGFESEDGQLLLLRAWNIVLTSRNPELQGLSSQSSAEQKRQIRRLEDRLHRAMYEAVISASSPYEAWESLLEEVTACEISVLRTVRSRTRETYFPPGTGVSAAFFQFRHLIPSGPLLALIAHQGRYLCHLVPGAGEVVTSLVAWADKLNKKNASSEGAQARMRDINLQTSVSNGPAQAADEASRKAVAALLPKDLPGLDTGADVVPWYLFPDGELHSVPIEVFPDPEDRFLGRRLALRYCLRPSVPAGCEARIDFSRGWLGLGGVPSLTTAMGPISYLAGARQEITHLQKALSALGYPAEAILGQEAHACRLAEELGARSPSILHLAVHGRTDPKYPDACSLILAAAPGAAEGALLPFRRIRDLPLAGVQLVILSACGSLIGPSDESAGIEGLAWAFLQAGATQVIASRYSVADPQTFKLMRILYRHLLDHPVAEALRRMRADGTKEGIDGREIGAWAVWS